MQLRPEDLPAVAAHRFRNHRPSARKKRRMPISMATVWRRLVEAWNVRPRPRTS
jgi:hypothetical protein